MASGSYAAIASVPTLADASADGKELPVVLGDSQQLSGILSLPFKAAGAVSALAFSHSGHRLAMVSQQGRVSSPVPSMKDILSTTAD